MIYETMTVQERFQASISLDVVDRHPIIPIIGPAAPRLYGVTQAAAWQDHNVARDAFLRCCNEYQYDYAFRPNLFYPMLPGKHCAAPVRNLIPGNHLPEDALNQIDEKELFPREDYDKIATLGWNGYWDEQYPKMSRRSNESLTAKQITTNQFYIDDIKIFENQGVPVVLGSVVDSPLMAFSLCRTLTEFTKDLYEVPDKVEAAMLASCDDLIFNAIQVSKNIGIPLAFIVLERGSGFYYRLDVFERFEWQFLQRYVDAFVSEGITPWMHLDTDWGINLPYFTKLPKGKCICDLDSTTDIFKAKEILKDHMCISGDVPASLLALGKPQEVEEYCKRLIDEVGDGGGFMLTTGCDCPVNVKAENLRAMVETGKSYRGKKGRGAVQQAQVLKEEAPQKLNLKGGIAQSIAALKFKDVMNMVDLAVKEGIDPLAIIHECRDGMDRVGELYSSGEYFLSELIMSANMFKKIMEKVEPLLIGRQRGPSLGAVVIATPKGDIHDLGKDIVAGLFKVAGFEVHDLGVDVDPQVIVDKVSETDAKVVAMSALITPTFDSMKRVVDLLEEQKLRSDRYVIIGGGPVTETVRVHVCADAWTLDPKQGVNWSRDFVEGRH